MRACKPLPYGQLTTALVLTVPSPCFLRQSSTFAKVKETFCVSFVLIRFVIGELLSEVGGRVGHGLVLAWFESYVLRLVFLDSSLQSPGQERHFGILFVPLRVVVREIHTCRDDNGGNGQPSMHGFRFFFFFCSSPGILRQPLHLAEREKHFGTFFVYVRLMVLELASLEKKKKKKKKKEESERK